MVLDDSLEIGSHLAKHYDIEDDLVFDIGLTPNRADAMSHYGTARDLNGWVISTWHQRQN